MSNLKGRSVVVTRALHQAGELARPLRNLGAQVLLLPTIGITEPRDVGPLVEAAKKANDYDWLIFTSINAVDAFTHYLDTTPGEVRAHVAVVGAATREHASRTGFTITITPEKYIAESLLEAFYGHDLQDASILIPAAAGARDVVPEGLRLRGAHVHVVEAYRNEIPPETRVHAARLFEGPAPDWITFASPSAMDNLTQCIAPDVIARSRIASIGPVTSNAIRRHGLRVDAEANPHTIPALVEAMESFYQKS